MSTPKGLEPVPLRLEIWCAVAVTWTFEVPGAKWSELRYGLIGHLEDHDGEASQA